MWLGASEVPNDAVWLRVLPLTCHSPEVRAICNVSCVVKVCMHKPLVLPSQGLLLLTHP